MDRELFEAALTVRKHAHAPYSGFSVGAALRTESGAIHTGCNVENAAFPEGWCAETTAIGGMVAASEPGEGRRIAAICVVADALDSRPVAPCGGCRQRIAEFAGPDTAVYCLDPDGKGSTWRLADLLPAIFELKGR
jgi:cytidine deaminase